MFSSRINDPSAYQWFTPRTLLFGPQACVGRAMLFNDWDYLLYVYHPVISRVSWCKTLFIARNILFNRLLLSYVILGDIARRFVLAHKHLDLILLKIRIKIDLYSQQCGNFFKVTVKKFTSDSSGISAIKFRSNKFTLLVRIKSLIYYRRTLQRGQAD